jgi:hypothetical protein
MSYEEIGLSGYVAMDGDINSLRHFLKKSIIFTPLWITAGFMH